MRNTMQAREFFEALTTNDTLPVDRNSTGVGVMDSEWVSVNQAANILGCHRETVRRMVKAGDIKAELIEVSEDYNYYRIRRVDLEGVVLRKPGRPKSK